MLSRIRAFFEKLRRSLRSDESGTMVVESQILKSAARLRARPGRIKQLDPDLSAGSSHDLLKQHYEVDNNLFDHFLTRSSQARIQRTSNGIGCLCPIEIEDSDAPVVVPASHHVHHRDGCLSSYIDVDSPGLGFELDCLGYFIQSNADDGSLSPQLKKASKHLTATVKDMPAFVPKMDFSPIDRQKESGKTGTDG